MEPTDMHSLPVLTTINTNSVKNKIIHGNKLLIISLIKPHF